jgi:two-component system CheB/CheR fusion protein
MDEPPAAQRPSAEPGKGPGSSTTNPSRTAFDVLKVTAWALIFGIVWILGTDALLDLIVQDHAEFARYQTFKGLLFAVLVALFIYSLSRRQIASLARARDELAVTARNLQSSIERQALAMEAAQLGSWTFDVQDRLVRFDARAAEHFNMGDVANIADVLEGLHPDDRPLASSAKQLVLSGAPMGLTVFRFRQADGSYRYIAVNSCAERNEPGSPRTQVIGTSQDVTHRKQSEAALEESRARLSAILNTALTAIIVFDEDRKIQSINAAASEIFGFCEDELIDRTIDQLVSAGFESTKPGHPYDGPSQANADLEINGFHKDGSAIPIRIGINSFCSQGHRYFTCSIVDLRRQKAAEQSLLEAERRLAQSEKMKAVGQMAGGLAHDMNNVLTIISGNLELILEQDNCRDTSNAARSALDAVQMGAALNRSLLTFSRQKTVSPIPASLNDCVRQVAGLLQRTLGEQVTLAMDLDTALGQACIDPSEVENAIVNLALNARDAMPNGGALTISTRNVSGRDIGDTSTEFSGEFVCLAVADNGEGMTKDIVDRALEPFFTTKEPGKGTGLGLSSVYGYVKQAGGHLAIDSKVGSGSVVQLYFPRSETHRTEPTEVAPVSNETFRGEGEMILVVDDNEAVRQVTVMRVAQLGYVPVEAATGAEAIEILRSNLPITIVLTDVVMPGGVSGYDVSEAATRLRPGIAVVLSSGFVDDQLRKDNKAVAHILLHKPYKKAQLATALRQALHK